LMTSEEREKIKRAVMKAQNVDEVRRLERMLREGWMPEEEKEKVKEVKEVGDEEVEGAALGEEEVEEEEKEE